MDFIIWFCEKMNDLPSAFWALFGIFAGALITGGYTHINNVRLKQIEYTNAFFQKLTEERFALYRRIEQSVGPFSKTDQFGLKLYPVIFRNIEKFREAAQEISHLNFKRRWLSEKSRKALSKFTKLLIDIHIDIKALGEDPDEVKLILLGIKHQQEIEDAYISLLDAVHEDIFELHDIKAFQAKYLK